VNAGAVLVLLAAAGFLAWQRGLFDLTSPSDPGADPQPDPAPWNPWNLDIMPETTPPAAPAGPSSTWTYPARGELYRTSIEAAEDRYGIPRGILGRLLYQESRFREDIMSGATRSAAGAVGIAQFLPATAAQYGFDPLDRWASIDGAGRYLRDLFAQFGTWDKALAAYNWGPGNVARKGLGAAPLETRNYYSAILGDTGYA
jgi:soluble lytic murein transglycosylase-like protein